MGNINKTFALILIGVIAISCLSPLAVNPANAQTIPKPSAPEFTVKYVDHSYTVPVNYTYTTDPYTGEQIETTNGGYYIENKTLEVKIKNQPFTTYRDTVTGRDYWLYYNMSSKGHYGENWSYHSPDPLYASNSNYTVVTFSISGKGNTDGLLPLPLGENPEGSQVDFRVQALFGYYREEMVSWTPGFRPVYDWVFTGTSSDWSNPQTIELPTESPSPIPNSLNSILENQQLTNIALTIGVVVLAVAVVSLLVYVRRIKKQLPKQ